MQEGPSPLETSSRTKCTVVRGTDHYLMMVTWRELLQRLHDSSFGEPEVQSDIRQLQGLAETMDAKAFLPLHQNELGPQFIRRMHHFQSLGVDAIEAGRMGGWITGVANSTSRWPGGYGRAFRLADAKAWFGLNGDLWSTKGDTPMWLQLEGVNPSLMSEEIQGKYRFYWGGSRFDIPIYLKTGVEREVVLDDVVSQLKEIADAVKTATSQS